MSWEIFWAVVVVFSVFSFTYMSFRIIILGFPELKEMFLSLSSDKLVDKDQS